MNNKLPSLMDIDFQKLSGQLAWANPSPGRLEAKDLGKGSRQRLKAKAQGKGSRQRLKAKA